MQGAPSHEIPEAFGRHLLTAGYSPETVRTYSRVLALFAAWCFRHEVSPMSVTRDAVERFLAEELQRVRQNTAALRLSVLRTFYTFLDGHDGRTHGLRIKLRKRAPRAPLTPDECQALLAACRNDRDRAMLIVALSLGLRVGEVVRMHDRHIDRRRGLLLVEGKGSKERLLPLSPELTTLLAPYLGKGPLWRMRDGRPMTLKRAQRNMEEISRRAKVRTHWHQLRTTFANCFLDATHDIDALQTLLGHEDANTTRAYAAFGAQQRALDAMRRFQHHDWRPYTPKGGEIAPPP